jgi:hypothetical protein
MRSKISAAPTASLVIALLTVALGSVAVAGEDNQQNVVVAQRPALEPPLSLDPPIPPSPPVSPPASLDAPPSAGTPPPPESAGFPDLIHKWLNDDAEQCHLPTASCDNNHRVGN